MRSLHLSLLAVICLNVHTASAADWPQWLGHSRDSEWRQDGVVERIPESGLQVKWRVPVGWGYAGPAVSNGKVYLMDYVHKSGEVTNSAGSRDALQGSERILCLNADSGEFIWQHEYDRPYSISYPKGPRCTPTVADGRVYALGAEGNLTCLDADTGQVVWSKDFAADYDAQAPQWGFTGHPLVDRDAVYCIVGGDGSVAVAFDKNTGRELWRSLSASEPGYCSPTMIEQGGQRRLLIWHAEAINSLDPRDGSTQWSTPLAAGFGVNAAVPRLIGDNIFATGAGNVSALLEAATGEILWSGKPNTSVGCGLSTPIVVDDVVYGNDGSGTLIAAKLTDGERLWQTALPLTGDERRGERNGTAFLVKNGDRFFLFNESGELILAKLTPQGYDELGRFQVLDPTNYTGNRDVVWSHPAFANKALFARNDQEIVCVSLARP